ncbi:MAG: acyl-CoA dehydrogenase family protein, partial [Proteobacteria bacterium]|nr:acyl-CoA dehydrogenase family protein [Pseudomonadota bacterium]
MDFQIDPKFVDLQLRIRKFVDDNIIGLEGNRDLLDEGENLKIQEVDKIRKIAKQSGLWAFQMPVARGGLGLPVTAMALCYEEAARSIFGPACFNIAAPDDGNMMILDRVAREDQKDRWLQPIIDGDVRSAFVMTEPMPGSGSDPTGMLTRAERRGDSWFVHGRKWFITGAGVAKHFILIARTSDDKRKGLSAFLFHADQPGWEIIRRIPIMGPEEHGGHCELVFDGLEIPDENRLMEIGDGLKLTQIRLGIAR